MTVVLRNLSLKGKTVVMNILVLPIIYYQCVMLLDPLSVLRDVDNLISSFQWRDKKPKISRISLEQNTASGGLGLHNFSNSVKGAKRNSLKRMAFHPTEPWQLYFVFKTDISATEQALRRTKPHKLAPPPHLRNVHKEHIPLGQQVPAGEG